MRKDIYQWALEYCGDPQSHKRRGEMILVFLQREGLKPSHKVLDVGCGALSQGKPLIEYLDPGNYVGLDPNGWLIEAALEKFPELLDKDPKFSYNPEFLTEHGKYDYVIAHSVLSHVASWQLEMALANVRTQVDRNAVWLASIRLAQEDTVDKNWVYPGVSHFRIGTVISKSAHAGWDVDRKPSYTEEMIEECPNDFHDWVALRSVLPPHEINRIRLDDEAREREDIEIMGIAKRLYKRRHDSK